MSTTYAPHDASQTIVYITPKQVNFLLDLADQRELGLTRDQMTQRVEGMTSDVAKRWITKALTMPRKKRAVAQPGYYVLGAGEAAEYLVVVANKAGTSTYAKKLDIRVGAEGRKTGSWVYAPGKGYAVAAMTPMTMDEAIAFSHLHGFCFRCGKALKDPKSVKASIGPVCLRKLQAAGVM